MIGIKYDKFRYYKQSIFITLNKESVMQIIDKTSQMPKIKKIFLVFQYLLALYYNLKYKKMKDIAISPYKMN